ncbi:MAG: superfamily helicase [Polaromonas sp.]|jgi:hypothetical protein|nr:superfamily helicase [Polaromonas sp.]
MSQLRINDYLKQLDIIKKASRSHRETIVREAFSDRLDENGVLAFISTAASSKAEPSTAFARPLRRSFLRDLRDRLRSRCARQPKTKWH